jgi:small subunit ribosomal protein S14
MAKTSMIERDKKRKSLSKQLGTKRKALKKIIMNKELSLEERFTAQLKLNKLPRNSSEIRYRNRCEITGRPRGFYRKFKMSRIALRDLAALGQVPGVVKSSW